MAKAILMDEFHLAIRAPLGLREVEYRRIRRTLDETQFHMDLRRAVRHLLRQYPALSKVQVALTR